MTKEERREYMREWRAKNREAIRAYDRRYQRAYQRLRDIAKKHKAHAAVTNERARTGTHGQSEGECEACGVASTLRIAHHDDYRKPDEVRLLCPPCHYATHAGRANVKRDLGSGSVVT